MIVPASAVKSCLDETTDLCHKGCIPGYLRSTDMGTCIRFGCSMNTYCVSCSDKMDTGSECTSCTAGYSVVTLTSEDETEYRGCYKNSYNGFCSVLGAGDCTNGCQFNIQKTIDIGNENEYVWECLPDTTDVKVVDDKIRYNYLHIISIVATVACLAAVMTGILLFFFVC